MIENRKLSRLLVIFLLIQIVEKATTPQVRVGMTDDRQHSFHLPTITYLKLRNRCFLFEPNHPTLNRKSQNSFLCVT